MLHNASFSFRNTQYRRRKKVDRFACLLQSSQWLNDDHQQQSYLPTLICFWEIDRKYVASHTRYPDECGLPLEMSREFMHRWSSPAGFKTSSWECMCDGSAYGGLLRNHQHRNRHALQHFRRPGVCEVVWCEHRLFTCLIIIYKYIKNI